MHPPKVVRPLHILQFSGSLFASVEVNTMISRVISCPGRLRQVLVTLAIVVVICSAGTAAAQSVSGTILGTVTDSSGSVIPSAKVTIINEGTGLTRTVQADSNGEYTA